MMNSHFFFLFLISGKEGKGKGQHVCYKMIASGSTRHSKINHQIKSPQWWGSPEPKGAQYPAVPKWGEGVRERKSICFPSLPPCKFKISHRALISSSKHGVTFVRLLLNNLVATLMCFLHLHKSSRVTWIYIHLLFLGLPSPLSKWKEKVVFFW